MKRTERQHLKENELERIARQAPDMVEARRREVLAGIVRWRSSSSPRSALLRGWHDRRESKAHALLAEAMAVQDTRVGPPTAPGTPSAGLSFPTERERAQAALTKFKIVADAYPSTDAGLFARFREAATEMALGNAAQARGRYQQVIDGAGDSIYGQMARLGLAEAQARSGPVRSGDQPSRIWRSARTVRCRSTAS